MFPKGSYQRVLLLLAVVLLGGFVIYRNTSTREVVGNDPSHHQTSRSAGGEETGQPMGNTRPTRGTGPDSRPTRTGSGQPGDLPSALEPQITSILAGQATNEEKLEQLTRLLENADPQGAEAVLPHIMNLGDAETAKSLVPYLETGAVSPGLQEELYSSFYDYDPVDTADLLLAVLNHGNNAFVEEARAALDVLLDGPEKDDPASLAELINRWRAEQERD